MMNYSSSSDSASYSSNLLNSNNNNMNNVPHNRQNTPYYGLIKSAFVTEQADEDYSFMIEASLNEKDEPFSYSNHLQPYDAVITSSDFDKRRRIDSYSSQIMTPTITKFSYIDTSFDDLAMAVEANSPDIDDGKPFMFDAHLSPSPGGKSRLRWTEEMDQLLLEGVRLYSDIGIGMWKRIAEYVQKHLKDPICDENGNVLYAKITNHQCGERYKHHLDPSIKQRKCGPWSQEEIDLLHELVNRHQTVASGYTQSGRTKSHVNWIKISNELNRNYRDCQHKWATVSKSSLKAGMFTKQEEEYIVRRVAELGSKEPGIWNVLEGEMGRKARSIQDKFNRLVKKRKFITDDIPIL